MQTLSKMPLVSLGFACALLGTSVGAAAPLSVVSKAYSGVPFEVAARRAIGAASKDFVVAWVRAQSSIADPSRVQVGLLTQPRILASGLCSADLALVDLYAPRRVDHPPDRTGWEQDQRSVRATGANRYHLFRTVGSWRPSVSNGDPGCSSATAFGNYWLKSAGIPGEPLGAFIAPDEADALRTVKAITSLRSSRPSNFTIDCLVDQAVCADVVTLLGNLNPEDVRGVRRGCDEAGDAGDCLVINLTANHYPAQLSLRFGQSDDVTSGSLKLGPMITF
jgi:hypothetical protein